MPINRFLFFMVTVNVRDLDFYALYWCFYGLLFCFFSGCKVFCVVEGQHVRLWCLEGKQSSLLLKDY